MTHPLPNRPVRRLTTRLLSAFGLAIAGILLAAGGVYVGETDDAPGAALLGILLSIGAWGFAIRIIRRRNGLNG